jgi:hypothetical protein
MDQPAGPGTWSSGFALWVAYGLARGDLPRVIPNTVALLIAALTITVAARRPCAAADTVFGLERAAGAQSRGTIG